MERRFRLDRESGSLEPAAAGAVQARGKLNLVMALPVIVLLVVYLPALVDLIQDWYHDDNYSHGFLIPVVVAWLLWNRRQTLGLIPICPDRRGLALVGLGAVMFVLANGAAEYFTLRLSLVVTLAGLVWLLAGAAFFRQVLFELTLLLFMIPIPYVIYYAVAFPLQLLASKMTATILGAVGATVVREGNVIRLAGTSLEVAEACSGLRSLVSLLALGFIWSHLSQRRTLAKVLLFVSTVPIAIIANVVRVLLMAVAAYGFEAAITQEPLHTIFGLVVFIVAMVLLMLLALVLRKVFP